MGLHVPSPSLHVSLQLLKGLICFFLHIFSHRIDFSLFYSCGDIHCLDSHVHVIISVQVFTVWRNTHTRVYCSKNVQTIWKEFQSFSMLSFWEWDKKIDSYICTNTNPKVKVTSFRGIMLEQFFDNQRALWFSALSMIWGLVLRWICEYVLGEWIHCCKLIFFLLRIVKACHSSGLTK